MLHFCGSKAVGLGMATVVMFLGSSAFADSFTEGFEGSGYDLSAGKATIVSSPVHSGAQALQLAIDSSSDYARVRLDTSAANMTLGQITSASYWVKKDSPTTEQAPYLLLSIAVPGAPSTDTCLAVMYNNPSITAGDWQNMTIDTTQLFHVESITTGLTNPSSITLADLAASTFSPGVTWGSFPVSFIRIGYGSGGNDGIAQTAYVDDLTVNYSPVPEPASLGLLGLGAMALLSRRRRV